MRSKRSIQSGAHKKQASEFEFENRSSRKRSDILENAVLEKKSHLCTPNKKGAKRNSNTSEKRQDTLEEIYHYRNTLLMIMKKILLQRVIYFKINILFV